jgi:AmiR/NasT family two-component response regulator
VTASSAGVDDDPTTTGLRILVADEDAAALRSTATVLDDLGHTVTAYAASVAEAAERIADEDPDLAVVAVHEDLQHALDLVEEIAESAGGPVVAVVERASSAEFLARAAERGIAAFARSEDPAEVQGAIEVAMRRHATEAQLSEQVSQLETALERRALIERAKGILMERHGVGDREAFGMLRDHARSRGRKVVDLAATVIEGHALLPRGGGAATRTPRD